MDDEFYFKEGQRKLRDKKFAQSEHRAISELLKSQCKRRNAV